MFSVTNGGLFHDGNFSDWPGQPGRGEMEDGDTVGLLVHSTLSFVYLYICRTLCLLYANWPLYLNCARCNSFEF
eukprot:COSAG06_NODE_1423_length_9499_cov_65.511967_9_plen_74_part_00